MNQLLKNNGEERSKAQIFILAAFLIAVIITLLAFSLNLVIYSENTSARGSAVAEETVLDHQDNLLSKNKRIMHNYNSNRTYDESELDHIGTEYVEIAERNRQTTRGALESLSYEHTQGTLVGQYSNKELYPTDSQNQEDWSVVTGEPELYYAQQRLETNSIPAFDLSAIPIFSFDPFTTQFVGSERYDVEIFRLASASEVRVRVTDGSSVVGRCGVSDSDPEVRIDYLENTVNDEECMPLENVDYSHWDINYLNSGNASGQYGIITSASPANVNSSVSQYTEGGPEPYYANQVTTITAETDYVTEETTYTGDLFIDVTNTDLEYIYDS